MKVRAWDVGGSEGRPVMGRIRVSTLPGTKVIPRPTGASLRERMENTLNGESQESWRWFDHPAERPLLWRVQSLVPTMVVSQRLSCCIGQPGSIKGSAFEVLEPYAGKLARTVLRGAGGAIRPPGLLGGVRNNDRGPPIAIKEHRAVFERLTEWSKRLAFPERGSAPLGFAGEYWDPDPKQYEGWKQLQDRLTALGRTSSKRGLAYDLASSLLRDAIVAAGGVERAVAQLRQALATLQDYATQHNLKAADGIPLGLGHEAAAEALYAFSDALSWSRNFIERLERRPERGKLRRQGLIPAIKPNRLRSRCEKMLRELQDGRVGESRLLANFILHGALARHPFSGVEIDPSGAIVLPIPDAPGRPVNHWYLLNWKQKRDGFALVEDMWREIENFVDNLLDAFENATPKRLRKGHDEATTA